MPVLLQVTQIMSELIGSLVYHLLLLLAVQAALAMAWGEWQRERQGQAQRLFVAMAGITVVNLGYVAAALITRADLAEAVTLLPPFGGFATTVSMALLAWAFVPPANARLAGWHLALIANLVLALGSLAVFTVLWQQAWMSTPALDYNTYWQSTIWDAWQIALILIAGFGLVRNQREGWGTAAVAMGCMLAGQLLGIAYRQGISGPHLPGWERLANLIAYPLLAVAVYQHSVARLRLQSRQLQDISQASLDQIKSLLHLSEVSQQMSSCLDLSTVLDNAVRGVARVLGADQCAIAFLLEEDHDQMFLAAIYGPERQRRRENITFPVEHQSAIQQAVRSKRHVMVERSDDVQLRALFGFLGSRDTGPLLVQPLFSRGEVAGVILVGNARTQRPFSPNEASLAVQLGHAIGNARHYQLAQQSIAEQEKAHAGDLGEVQQTKARLLELTELLASTEAELEALRLARSDLESRLLTSQAETDKLARRLLVLETEMAQKQAQWQGTFQAMLPGMAAGVLVTDDQGLIRATNMAAEILLERSAGELIGLDIRAISSSEDWQKAVVEAKKGETVHLEMRVDANMMMCDVAPLPNQSADRESVGGLAVILQGVSPAAEAQKAKLETIASIADELRTPVSTVIGYADLLLSEAIGGVAGVQRKFLLRIKADAERMMKIANDLAGEAGGDLQRGHPQKQAVKLNELVEESLASVRTQLETRTLSIDLELANDLPALDGDPDYLRRALSGLLANACMASPVGGRIKVQTVGPDASALTDLLDQANDSFVTVSIKDQGGGLSDEALTQVFDRTRPSQTPPGLGESGPGLALVKTLVEAHGGYLWVESDEGVSTTFSFVLPVRRDHGQFSFDHLIDEREEPVPASFTAG
jgi:signal transduction histidine kinase